MTDDSFGKTDKMDDVAPLDRAWDIGKKTLRAGFHGAVAGGIVCGTLTRLNMRVAFYGAAIGFAIGAGRELYNTFKGGDKPPSNKL